MMRGAAASSAPRKYANLAPMVALLAETRECPGSTPGVGIIRGRLLVGRKTGFQSENGRSTRPDPIRRHLLTVGKPVLVRLIGVRLSLALCFVYRGGPAATAAASKAAFSIKGCNPSSNLGSGVSCTERDLQHGRIL